MAPECQEKNLRDLTMVAVGVNKSAEQYMLLDDQTRDELAAGKFHDQRRGSFGTSVPSASPAAPATGPAAGKNPVATAGKNPVATAGKNPVATAGKNPAAAGRNAATAAGKNPVATAGKNPVATAGENPGAAAGKDRVVAADGPAVQAGPVQPARRSAPSRRRPVSREMPRPWSKSQEKLALLYNEQGRRPEEIAHKLGLSTYIVTQIILASRNRGKL